VQERKWEILKWVMGMRDGYLRRWREVSKSDHHQNPTTSEDADHVLFLAASRPEHVARLISCCSKTSAPAMLSKFSLVVIISTFSPTL
jgi:hypothetical protein